MNKIRNPFDIKQIKLQVISKNTEINVNYVTTSLTRSYIQFLKSQPLIRTFQ